MKKSKKEMKAALDEPRSVELHCFYDPGMNEIMMTDLLYCCICQICSMKGITGTGNYAQVAEGNELFAIESINEWHVLGYFLQVHKLWRK